MSDYLVFAAIMAVALPVGLASWVGLICLGYSAGRLEWASPFSRLWPFPTFK